MNLNFTVADQAFRKEVKNFLNENLSQDIATKMKADFELSKVEIESWHAVLHQQGWLTYSWPKEYGGTGWNSVQQFIFEEESAMAGAPRILPFGLKMLAPVLMEFGSKEQKDYWLPRMCDGQDWWCQGYSEPGSGSDLASLKTSAVRDGKDYIINGQKTWTTLGQHANMIFCLVRTNATGKPQAGISFILVDLATPGIEMRPIQTFDGGKEVNEVFFTDVRVPASNLVGEENMGWTYAKYLLAHERNGIANVGISNQKLTRLKRLALSQKRGSKPLAEDPLFAARLARLEIELRNLETTNLRVLDGFAHGAGPGPESSMLKIIGSELEQDFDDLTRRALGRHAQAHTPEVFEKGYNGPQVAPKNMANQSTAYFNKRKVSIYGGSNEIQKNIITKMILEL
jgi:alkylation response protein AidB-like acyl-CoA dehydrogenase|tara:strand:+ start:1481 stop:2677 length:1197 start_codon:yes stop_codon:yes gene_type:complete